MHTLAIPVMEIPTRRAVVQLIPAFVRQVLSSEPGQERSQRLLLVTTASADRQLGATAHQTESFLGSARHRDTTRHDKTLDDGTVRGIGWLPKGAVQET